MCGRFTLRLSTAELQELFDALRVENPQLRLRYNICPSQTVAVVKQEEDAPTCSLMRWGMIPHWAKEVKGLMPINARAESIAEKPTFKVPFKKRRCLIPADGFYEWETIEKKKQPYFIHMKDDAPFAFAGIWNRNEINGEVLETFSLITTEPNELMAQFHDRMPVIIPKAKFEGWLTESNEDALKTYLKSYPAEEMEAYKVSLLVNSPKNDVPQCLLPLAG